MTEKDGRVFLSANGGGRSTCEISLYGGHILSWIVDGRELLFMSSKAEIGVEGKAIRGGIPICWPQFGGFDNVAAGAPKKKHGLVRTSNLWKVAGSAHGSEVTLRLAPDENMKQAWRGDFAIFLRVSLDVDRLQIMFKVENHHSSSPLEFTGALHTYFNVEDSAECRVMGLKDCVCEYGVKDKFTGDEKESRPMVSFGPGSVGYPSDGSLAHPEVENMYGSANDEITLYAKSHCIRLTKSNWTDWVLWNIGQEKAPSMSDLGEGEHKNYVCIEAAAASRPVVVPPETSWVSFHELRYDEVAMFCTHFPFQC